ncbi:SPOR domain-containing protein [Marinomonas ostreistagni]|uniref:SPOR domain-containing protein n=1 Tax=Marinomonas ostreistagni TaxID=359209 RepID=UPI0019510629|nr:SPOR domain-containing protein [Marinomonas ostreistagni]MBM6552287.1 SPOR domain-containing protein [Marinomonas ostreistagni]
MKWLFLLLVLANAGFIAWQGFSGADNTVAEAPIYGPPVSEKIYLVDEVSGESATPVASAPSISQSERVASEINQAVVQTSSNESQTSLLCPAIEVERSQDQGVVEAALGQAGLAFTRQQSDVAREKYWLYIPAPGSSARARSMVNQLKQQGIDSYVVGSGEMQGRISLGLFSSQMRAQQAQESIADQTNMLVSIYQHQRTVSVTELLLDEPIAVTDWEAFLSRLDLSKLLIKIEKNPC